MRPAVELSFTRGNDARCAFRFQQLYILGTPEPDFDESISGSRLHEVAGLYRQSLADRNRVTDHDGYLEILNPLLHGLRRSTVRDIRDVADEFRFNYEQTVDADLHMIEHRLGVLWPSLEPWDGKSDVDRICGTPDHVCLTGARTQAIVQDEKYGGRAPDVIRRLYEWQVKLYLFLVKQHYPEIVHGQGIVWPVRYGLNSRSLWDVHDWDALGDEVRTWAEPVFAMCDRHFAERGNEAWPATGGEACDWCNLTSECPSYRRFLAWYLANGVEDAPPSSV